MIGMISTKSSLLLTCIFFVIVSSKETAKISPMPKTASELAQPEEVHLSPVATNPTHQLNLTWKIASTDDRINIFIIGIYTRNSPKPNTLNITDSPPATSHSHILTHLTPGEIYKAKVTSYNDDVGGNTSQFSNSLRTNPLPPQNVTYNSTADSITVTWVEPASSLFDYYNLVIYYKTVFLDKEGLEYTRTGLSPNRKYNVKLRCYSLWTEDAFDATAAYSRQISEDVYTRPEKATLKSVSLVSDNRTSSILVHFEPSDAGVNKYVILITPVGGDWDESHEITTTKTVTQVNGLKTGGEYSVGVKAEGKGGRSEMSNEETITLSPPQPFNITLEESRTNPSTQLIVRWRMPDTEFILSGYFIQIINQLTSEETYKYNLHTTTPTVDNQHVMDNLISGSLYTVRVTCYSGLTLSYASRESESKGTSLPTPKDIRLLKSSSDPSVELNVTWRMPSYDYIVTSYEVAIYSEQSATPELRLLESDVSSSDVGGYFRLGNLTPGVSYKTSVRCLGLTSGTFSAKSNVQKTDPLPPEDFRMSEEFPGGTVDFMWKKPRSNSTISSYYLHDDVSDNHILVDDDDVTDYHFRLCCLNGNSKFHFVIKSCSNHSQNSSWEVIRTCSIEESVRFHTVPGTPSNIRLLPSSADPSSELQVEFTPPLGGADEYVAKLGSISSGEITTFTSPTSPITMTSLFPGDTYDVIVGGRSWVSGSGNFTGTKEITLAPLPVRDLRPRNGSGPADFLLTWELPAESESLFTSLSVTITDISNNLTEQFLLSPSATECVVPSSHLGKHLCASVLTISGTVESAPVSVNFTYVESHIVAPEANSSTQREKSILPISLVVALIAAFAVFVLVVAVLIVFRFQRKKRNNQSRR